MTGGREAGGHDIQTTLDALGSPVRREILSMIWAAELSVGDIASGVRLSAGTVSNHLAVLRRAGLVAQRSEGAFHYHRVVRAAMAAVLPLLAGSEDKWRQMNDPPPHANVDASLEQWVTVSADVSMDQAETFASFADAERYSAWLGVPVRIVDGWFSIQFEWGGRVRGRYEVVAPPDLIAIRWHFDDPAEEAGRHFVCFQRFLPHEQGCRIEVYQRPVSSGQSEFLTGAWQTTLARFKAYADGHHVRQDEP